MRITSLVTMLSFLVGAGAPLYGQSLADVAKKEEDRRKTVKGGGTVITNKDLKPVLQPEPAATADSSSPDTPADTKEPADTTAKTEDGKEKDGKETKDEAKAETKDRTYWFGRMQGLREQLSRDQLHAEALQSQINGLTADFSSRDDPAQRTQIGLAREKALAELARLKKEIEEGGKAISDLEDEARRAQVPPGWLR